MISLFDKYKTIKAHNKLGVLKDIRTTLGKELAIITWFGGGTDAIGIEKVEVVHLSRIDREIAMHLAEEVPMY